jgi:hypothetical protein
MMQSWTNFTNKGETAANLKDLGSQFKLLPPGWKFRTKVLDRDLTVHAAAAEPPGVGDAGRVQQHLPGLRL